MRVLIARNADTAGRWYVFTGSLAGNGDRSADFSPQEG
jgi:hypothetical protein